MVIWITGLSGSGKTTIANMVYKLIKKNYINTILLDGDIIREALNHSFGYTLKDREKGAYQIHGLCKMLEKEEMIVICATMSLFHKIQEKNRTQFSSYIEVFLDVEKEVLFERDPKNLYSKALEGKEKNVVGIDLKYEKPLSPELTLRNNIQNEKELNVSTIYSLFRRAYENHK